MLKSLPMRVYTHFPAFKYKNYRLYFLGQLISFTGSWLHGVAHGWLIYQLTQSPFWLGAVSAISTLPVLGLSLFGGFLVDRYSRKKLLIFTQSSQLVLALILGILTLTHTINIQILLILTFLSGVSNSIDNPVTQAFVVDIVGKDELPSAVGLNSTMFNAGKVLGPAIAGFLIARIGTGNIFLINAASFSAILISLYFIHVQKYPVPVKNVNALKAIGEGIKYSYAHPLISWLLLTAGIGTIFCFSQATIMPVLAEKIFQAGTVGLGYLLSAMGLGALTGSLVISSQSQKIRAYYFIAMGNLIFIMSSFFFTFMTNIRIASFSLFFAGFGLTLQFSTIYASIQRLVKEEYRGRVSSLYVLLFIGFSPIGNVLIGSITSLIGPLIAIRLFLTVTLIYGIFIFFKLPKARKKFAEYQKE